MRNYYHAYVCLSAAALLTVIASLAAWAATPADPVMATYYAPDARISASAVTLVNSATGSINIASNAFSDTHLTGALCTAASRGVAVQAVLNVTPGTAATIPYRELIASGGSVWLNSQKPTIPNQVFTIDGGTCATGNYVWSGSAVQAGAWWAIITGTRTTSGFNATFGSLQTSGTRQ
jgi:phosphatidylserine/phosphatidylglycerophosphate/cardiolipin synthase-like enzyme